MSEIILIVDDEESVRKTFREWLDGAGLDCTIRVAADAESALVQANQEAVDLAVLDWNLGTGSDGLQLLEDLYEFNPDVVAILVTGHAHQATPLDAMRMGVRDYLDKNQDLNRTTFVAAVQRQLDRIRPAKQARRLHQQLAAFRTQVDQILPLVQSAAALNDPVPLPLAIGSLIRFLLRTTGAQDAVLLVRGYDPSRQPAETVRAYGVGGQAIEVELAPFARSLAGMAVNLEEPCLLADLDSSAASGAVLLHSFERGRRSLLASALPVAGGVVAVLELFDKPGAFTSADRELVAAAAEFGTEMLRQALAERQTQRLLLDAVAAARQASESVSAALPAEPPLPPPVLDRLRAGLKTAGAPVDADATLRLVEAVRVLAVKHGPAAVQHCITLVEDLRALLDQVTGSET